MQRQPNTAERRNPKMPPKPLGNDLKYTFLSLPGTFLMLFASAITISGVERVVADPSDLLMLFPDR